MNTTEEKTSKLENRAIETTQTKAQVKRGLKILLEHQGYAAQYQ